jgi:benzoyl-CoA reductase/2-hydroxyglutaryl-CoA dehydratase subunit BcrC/BadD/HgdB
MATFIAERSRSTLNTEVLEIFRQAVEDPGKEVREWKEKKGGKVVGFLLTDVPEELIHAAGFFPFGICGGTVRMDQVEAHLQFWSCSYVRNSLALALDGKLDFLDGLVIPHICDTTRMLMGIWKHVRPLPFMDSFRLPRQVGRPSAKQYVAGELTRIKERLNDFRGTEITDEELSKVSSFITATGNCCVSFSTFTSKILLLSAIKTSIL